MPETFPTRFTLPLAREVRFTSRLNRLSGGSELRTQDQIAPLFRWNLKIGPIGDAELSEIETFHAARGGAYESFVFLDPLDNLLRWSEDFSQFPWQKSNPSALQVSSGISDPLGGSAAQTLGNKI